MFTALTILLNAHGSGLLFGVAGIGVASGVLKIHLKKRNMHGIAHLIDQLLYLGVGWIVGDFVLDTARHVIHIFFRL